MLVLSRKVNEGIRIADNIEVIVTRVSGDRVRIGVRAPLDVPIVRSELLPLKKIPQELVGGEAAASAT